MRYYFISVFFILTISLDISAAGLSSPAKTIKRAEAGKTVKPTIQKTTNNKKVEVLPCFYSEKDIPPVLRKLRHLENVNARYQDPDEFGDPIDMKVLGPYDPILSEVFYVPYIPIPRKDFSEYLVGRNISPAMSKTLFFKYDGQEFARYFIHPSKTSSYDDLIQRYGIVRDEFVGFEGASPRSIYTWHPEDPTVVPFVAKTSLHFEIDGSVRINPPPKAARSFLVNDILSRLPQSVKDQYKFDVLPETAQLMPRGRATATLIRELTPIFENPRRTYIPGFYLSSEDNGNPPLILKLIENEPNKLQAAAETMRPLMAVIAYLMFKEGLKGEPHEQNVYFDLRNMWVEVDHQGKATGKMMIKDLDGFRVDVEMRIRQGKSVEGLSQIFKPFVYGKFSNASGWGAAEGIGFDQTSYFSFIKHTFGYSFCQVFKCSNKDEAELYAQFDRVMAEETSKVTGLAVNPQTLSVNNTDEVEGLKNVSRRLREDANEAVYYSQLPPKLKATFFQNALKAEFLRLREQKRTSSILANLENENIYFLLHNSVIEARLIDRKTKHESAVGFAALFPENNPQTVRFKTRLNQSTPRWQKGYSSTVVLDKSMPLSCSGMIK